VGKNRNMWIWGGIGACLCVAGIVALSLLGGGPMGKWKGTPIEFEPSNQYDNMYQRTWFMEPEVPKHDESDGWRTDWGGVTGVLQESAERFDRIEDDYSLDSLLTTDQFELNGGGVCDDWNWWLFLKLGEKGYNVRWTVGRLEGQENPHAWVTLFMESGVWVIDQNASVERAVSCKAYTPQRSYQFNAVWKH